MSVVLVTSDLMVVSHVQGAAARAGVAVQTAANADQAAELAKMTETRLVIVDLAMPSLELSALVTRCKAQRPTAPRIVAFGPHVHEDRLAAARHAGCDAVMSRGQFFSQVDALLP